MQINKILIVDNDKEFLKEFEEMLQLNGYETLIHSNPQKALKDVKLFKPKIILFDINLDGKNGYKFAKRIKYFLKKFNIYTIATTGFCDDKDYKKLVTKSGIITCLTKPINPKEFLEKIDKIFKNNTNGLNNDKSNKNYQFN